MTFKTNLKTITKKFGVFSLAVAMVISSIVPALTVDSSAFSGKKGSTYTTHSGGQIRYADGDGGYSNTLKCDLGDSLGSRYSYCVQPHRESPKAGRATVDKVVDDDLDKGKWNAIRNVLYYSPSYPGYDENVRNIKDRFYTGSFTTDWAIAHIAQSWIYAGRPASLPVWDPYHTGATAASELGSIWPKAQALANHMYSSNNGWDDAVPAGFKCFVCFQGGVQDMLVGYLDTGWLELKKSSSNPGISKDNSCYSLAGAVYDVYNSADKKVGSLTTKADGTTDKIELPVGDYTVKEVESSKGYAVDQSSHNVTIKSEETTTTAVKEVPTNDPVAIFLNKMDKETGKASPLEGASLEGAIYEVKYYDAQFSKASDASASHLKKTWKFKTDKKGQIDLGNAGKYFVSGHDLYKSNDGKRIVFPIGTYVITEITPPEGYLLDATPHVANVTEVKNTKQESIETYNMLGTEGEKVYEQVERGDLEFIKKDIAEERLANCVFKITSESTGESHIVVTDPNGKFTSVGKVNVDTVNKNDEALKADGTLDESKLNFKNKVWFGMNKEGDSAKPNAQLRPFPYDTYTITELPCKANENKSLISTKAVVYEDGYVCDLGTITDADIGTTLKDENGKKKVITSEKTTLVDTVKYEKLKVNQKYVLECTLMVKDTKEPLVENGEPIKGTAEFTPKSNSGTQDVTIEFNTIGLEGKEIVAFEELYKVKEDGSKGDLVATHKDIEDEGQTVKFFKVEYNMYKIRTTDAPEAIDPDGKYGFAKGEAVDYDVIIENTGDIDLTMDVSDNFENKGYFSTPVVSKVTGATWNNEGKDQTIANITVKAGEKAVVTFTAKVEEAPVKLADTAKDSDSKFKESAADGNTDVSDADDSQNNNNQSNEQVPAEEDEGVDCNMKDQTNEPVDDGWTNTAKTTDVTYIIDDDERHLDDKEDIAQTPVRSVPKIGTYLTADSKKKVVASKETKFVDTVAYEGLTPGNTYIMECTLMVKSTEKPLEEDGEPITGTTTFVPEKEKGTTEVEFTIDTTGLEGEEIVAFEVCYNTKPAEVEEDVNDNEDEVDKNREIADHKDIKDKAQTVLIIKPATPKGPKTGDDSNLMIYLIAILVGGALGTGFYAFRKKTVENSNNNNNK